MDKVEIEFLEWAHPIFGVTPVKLEGGAPLVLKAKIRKPKREWVSLTDDEIFNVAASGNDDGCFGDFQWQHDTVGFVRAIEAKLKEKNNG